MSDIKPLPIYSPTPLSDDDFARIRAAKQRLALPFLAQFGRAVAGSPTRVLAIGGKPDFVCEYAEVPNTSSAGLDAALAWVLGEHDDSRAMTMAETLTDMFGGEVVEVEDATDGTGAGGLGASTTDHGLRGEFDPNRSDESSYRSALRASRTETAGVR